MSKTTFGFILPICLAAAACAPPATNTSNNAVANASPASTPAGAN